MVHKGHRPLPDVVPPLAVGGVRRISTSALTAAELEAASGAWALNPPCLDAAVIGIIDGRDGLARLVYSYDLLVERYAEEWGVDSEDALVDAWDWVEHHTLGWLAYAGPRAPVVVDVTGRRARYWAFEEYCLDVAVRLAEAAELEAFNAALTAVEVELIERGDIVGADLAVFWRRVATQYRVMDPGYFFRCTRLRDRVEALERVNGYRKDLLE